MDKLVGHTLEIAVAAVALVGLLVIASGLTGNGGTIDNSVKNMISGAMGKGQDALNSANTTNTTN